MPGGAGWECRGSSAPRAAGWQLQPDVTAGLACSRCRCGSAQVPRSWEHHRANQASECHSRSLSSPIGQRCTAGGLTLQKGGEVGRCLRTEPSPPSSSCPSAACSSNSLRAASNKAAFPPASRNQVLQQPRGYFQVAGDKVGRDEEELEHRDAVPLNPGEGWSTERWSISISKSEKSRGHTMGPVRALSTLWASEGWGRNSKALSAAAGS